MYELRASSTVMSAPGKTKFGDPQQSNWMLGYSNRAKSKELTTEFKHIANGEKSSSNN